MGIDIVVRRILISQLLLLMFTVLNAQNYTSRIDSIEELIQNHPRGSSKQNVELLELLNFQHLAGSQGEMFRTLGKLENSGIDETDVYYSEYLWWKANACLLDNKNRVAADLFNQILDQENPEYHFHSLLGLAWAFKDIKNTNDSCMFYLSEAKRYADKEEDEYMLACYYASLGKFYKNTRRPQLGKKNTYKALQYFEKQECELETGQNYANLAHCYYLEAQYDSTVIFGQKATPYLMAAGAYRLLCSNYNVLGTVLQNTEQLKFRQGPQ